MKPSTLGLVDSHDRAGSAVEKLTMAGFSRDAISVVAPDEGSASEGEIGEILNTLGVPDHQARRYQDGVKDGSILISVRTENSDRAREADRVFEQVGAYDVFTTAEARADERIRDLVGPEDTGTWAGSERRRDATRGAAESVGAAAPVQDLLGPEGTAPITGVRAAHFPETAEGEDPRRRDASAAGTSPPEPADPGKLDPEQGEDLSQRLR